MDEDRPLQLLDDEAQEMHGALWSVDDPDLAEIGERDGEIVLHAKGMGRVRVTASLSGETRTRDIVIWPKVPNGLTRWGGHPIGREIADIPAVPVPDGPHMYSLEETADGKTYLRANRDDGIQLWTWLMPETNHDTELVCGDWLGGAVISSNRPDSYTLYVIGKDGKLMWKRDAQGFRKSLAINTDHMLYLLTQSADKTSADLAAIDVATGTEKFDLPLPASRESFANVKKDGSQYVCAADAASHLLPMSVSHVIVNMDHLPYLAFSEVVRTIGTDKCTPGTPIAAKSVSVERDESVVIWRIHTDGSYRITRLDAARGRQALSSSLATIMPTDGIVTDNMNGLLVPVTVTPSASGASAGATNTDLIYRLDPQGELLYKMALPNYSGARHDDVVIADNDLGFTTRGTLVIAFDVTTGKDLWHWDSNTPDIHVFAALANKHCLVQTPTALVEVAGANEATELAKGKAIMDWQGRLFVQSKD